jgi:ABC-type multidrug transport system ATPase subunit
MVKTTANMSILSVQQLSKRYGPIQALDGVSFDVPKGTVFGILGPNGSGKTTTLGIVSGVLKPTSGTFRVFDEAPSAGQRKRIGTLLETPNFYHYLSAVENLKIAAGIKGRGEGDIDSVLAKVNLLERKHSAFSTFSLGMKQRLAIASSLLGSPEVLVLDEPTNGLDPVGIAEIRELIKSLSKEGKTIIMASHLLDEVEKVCTHMVLLKKGKVIVTGQVSEILAQGDVVEVSAAGSPDLPKVLGAYPGVKKVQPSPEQPAAGQPSGGRFELIFDSKDTSLAGINEYCFAKGVTLDHLTLKRKSLESRFLELTEDTQNLIPQVKNPTRK